MTWKARFTERELKEIEFSVLYDRDFAHDTEGRNAKIVIAKMAELLDSINPAAFEGPLTETIQAARKAKGLTQDDLARLCHVTRTTITNVELGYSDPSLTLLQLIAAHLGMKLRLLPAETAVAK